MLKNYKTTLDRLSNSVSQYKKESKSLDKEVSSIQELYDDHKAVLDVFKQAALLAQSKLENHMGSIVTQAIKFVFFDKDIEFKIQFVERRDTTECDLFIVENGKEYDIMNSRGHGLADICSIALRIAYIILDNVDNVLFLDEPFRNLNKDRHPYASLMLKEIAHQRNMQVIINTHVPDIADHADHVIRVVIEDNQSKIKERKC